LQDGSELNSASIRGGSPSLVVDPWILPLDPYTALTGREGREGTRELRAGAALRTQQKTVAAIARGA